MTIDGKNIYTEYGCTLLAGSFDTLLKYPKRKAVKYNNWAESNGIEPDLSLVEFEPKTVKLTFLMQAYGEAEFWRLYRKLTSDMSATGYREISLIPGTITRLRLNAGTSYELPVPMNEGKNVSSFDMNFIEDIHTISQIPYPTGGISLRGQMSINGYDFGEFGIGSDEDLEDVLKIPAAKSPFTDGHIVDLSKVKAQHKEIKLNLWMLADSVEEFLHNYRAFFTQLTRTDTQELYINTLENTTQVYYSDCPSFSVEVWQDNKIAVRFTISLVAPIASWVDSGGVVKYRVLKDMKLGFLADEEGRIIVFN